MKYKLEEYNIHGTGYKKHRTFYVAPQEDYWVAITNINCPCCDGIIIWWEAGYVPAYRKCNKYKREFLGKGDKGCPKLIP